MNDWQTMAAGRELDRVVAARLGWHIEQRFYVIEGDHWLDGDYPELVDVAGLHEVFVMVDHLGNIYPADWNQPDSFTGYVNEQSKFIAWDQEYTREHWTPKYSASADVALTLFDTLPDKHEAHLDYAHGMQWVASIYRYPIEDGTRHVVKEYADTPALAICRAWLAWKDMR